MYLCIIESVVFGCNCTDLVDRRGYGNCKKPGRSRFIFPFRGELSCFVNLPSSCPDLVNSPVESKEYPEKKISAEACKDDINIAGKVYKFYILSFST